MDGTAENLNSIETNVEISGDEGNNTDTVLFFDGITAFIVD